MSEAEWCRQVDESMSSVIDGVASEALFDHIATCERCRDARHEAEQLTRRIAQAGADYHLPDDLESRLLAIIDAAEASPERRAEAGAAGAPHEASSEDASGIQRAPHALIKREADGPKLIQVAPQPPRPRPVWVWLSAAAAVVLGALWLSSRPDAPLGAGGSSAAAHGAWQGEVLQVQRAFGSASGLSVCDAAGACAPAGVGDPIPPGARLATDGLTRALVKFADGTRLALDRATRLELDAAARRRARLVGGNVVAEVQERLEAQGGVGRSVPVHERAVFESSVGRAEVLGTKLALRADRDLLRVEVSRGAVKLVDAEDREAHVLAGEAGAIGARVAPRVESVVNLAPAFSWSSEAFAAASAEEHLGALGELRAKRPGDRDERTHAVSLTEHHVKVRIVDNVARTEVEEVFTNQTDDVLEGIYRFPLPPGAQIERLALDVDGKLVDGAFVERERAAAIWRGAIVNSGGKKAPKEEIIWVPGPWKDPALLEWQRGNRFELRIFPIPRRGARRIVLAYTQLLAPTEGGREYVYPLPLDPGGTTRAERFTFEAELRGHDLAHGVATRGYSLTESPRSPEVTRLAFESERFSPVGDLAIAFRLPSTAGALRAWAYQPSGGIEPPSRRTDVHRPYGTVPGAADASRWDAPASAPYVAIALRPELPRRAQHTPRDYVLIADVSRSMIGESYRRAALVVERTIAEMDRQDRVAVLACDSVCQSLPGEYRTPGPESAQAAARFLQGIEPEGASDLAFAVEQAAALAGRGRDPSRALRIVYVGDGTPTVGPIHPALLGRAMSEAMPRGATLTAVAIGSDADRTSLEVATEAAGGVTLTFAPGQSAEEAAYAVLGATYGHSLKNARVTLPDGLVAVAPSHLGTIAAGAEELIVARMLRPEVDGEVMLRGELAGEPFEQRYTLNVSASTSEGNAFVPRLYAAAAITELDRSIDESARRRSIELSTRFNVASRYTSLLVLESAAMFKAFGLDNQRLAPEWSGDQETSKAETWGESPIEEMPGALPDRSLNDSAWDDSGSATGAGRLGAEAHGSGAPQARGGRAASPPAASRSRPAPRPAAPPSSAAPELAEGWAPRPPGADAEKKKAVQDVARDSCGCALSDWECRSSCRPAPDVVSPLVERHRPLELPARRMIPMRRVWDRVGRIEAPPRPLEAVLPSRRPRLEARAHELELSRSALKELYVFDFLAGDLERAADSAARWSEKDPLDPDALTARADLAAQRGNRELAIRILGSVVDVRPGDYKAQWRLARLHRWAGAPARGCRHSLAVAQLMLTDAKLVSEAVRCARDVGQTGWAEDLLAAVSAELRSRVERLSAEPPPSDELNGDLQVRASWDGAEHDLDLVILHPEGYRVSWLGAPTRAVISATDVLSVHREGLALRGASAGEYAVELVRTSPALARVRGQIELRVGKESRSVPFVLDGERVRVATARIRLQSRLVPVESWPD